MSWIGSWSAWVGWIGIAFEYEQNETSRGRRARREAGKVAVGGLAMQKHNVTLSSRRGVILV